MANTPPSEAAAIPRPRSSCMLTEPEAADCDMLFVEPEPQQSWGVSEGLFLHPDTDRMGAWHAGPSQESRRWTDMDE